MQTQKSSGDKKLNPYYTGRDCADEIFEYKADLANVMAILDGPDNIAI